MKTAKKKSIFSKAKTPYEAWHACLDKIADYKFEIESELIVINTVLQPVLLEYRSGLIWLCDGIIKFIEADLCNQKEKASLIDFMGEASHNVKIIGGELPQKEVQACIRIRNFIVKSGQSNKMIDHDWPTTLIRDFRYSRRLRHHIEHVIAIEHLTPILREIPEELKTKTYEFDDFLSELYEEVHAKSEDQRIKISWLTDKKRTRKLINEKFLERQFAWEFAIGEVLEGEFMDEKCEDDFQRELGEFRLKELDAILNEGNLNRLLELETLLAKEFDIDPVKIENNILEDDFSWKNLSRWYALLSKELILTDPKNSLVELYDIKSTFFKMEVSIAKWGRGSKQINSMIKDWIELFEQSILCKENAAVDFKSFSFLFVYNSFLNSLMTLHIDKMANDHDFDSFI